MILFILHTWRMIALYFVYNPHSNARWNVNNMVFSSPVKLSYLHGPELLNPAVIAELVGGSGQDRLGGQQALRTHSMVGNRHLKYHAAFVRSPLRNGCSFKNHSFIFQVDHVSLEWSHKKRKEINFNIGRRHNWRKYKTNKKWICHIKFSVSGHVFCVPKCNKKYCEIKRWYQRQTM